MDASVTLLLHAASGFGMGISLIAAIGAQNAFVLRQGIRRERVLVIVAICALSDALLIALGIGGIGFVIERMPVALDVVRFAGAAFLFAYGLLAAKRVFSPRALAGESGGAAMPLWSVIATCLALTWLNPHVYLDTVLLLGSVASGHGTSGRWWFGAGAIVASIVWFAGLGFGARLLRGVFAKPVAWRVLDGIIAAVMIALGIQLLATR